MPVPKLSIVGAGHVGATTALLCAQRGMGRIVLVDAPALDGMPQGKALDLLHATPLLGSEAGVEGSNDLAATEGSDLLIVTAGIARKPGMSRDDLLRINARIVGDVVAAAAPRSPRAVLLVVSNPITAMTHVAWRASGFDPRRVLGQTGVLDAARFRALLAAEIGCSPADIQAMVLGDHGPSMVLLPRYTTVAGIPVEQLLARDRLDPLIARARHGGEEVLRLQRTSSASAAPAAAIAEMAEAILRDRRRLMPAAAWCDGAYAVPDLFVGVPCVLGASGVQRVVEIDLSAAERAAFGASVAHIRELLAALSAA